MDSNEKADSQPLNGIAAPLDVPGGQVADERAAHQSALRLRVLGFDVRLLCMHSESFEVLAQDWSRCVVPATDGGAATSVRVMDDQMPLSEWFGYSLASQLTALAIRELAGQCFMFHACGLADDSGRVVALVASSGTGKTTMAAAHSRTDFGYVTDETVAVDDAGAVLPYPKPLSIVQGADNPGRKVQKGPDELGLRRCPDSLSLARLVLLERTTDPQGPPTLEPVPLLDALIALTPQTSSLAALERPLQRLCHLIDRCGGVYRLTYSEASDTASLLQDLLAGPSEADPQWSAVPDSPGHQNDMAWAMWDGRVHRVPYLDAVQIGDEALVLIGQTPMRLSGIGLTIWREASPGATLEELQLAAVAAHGPHPDAAALVRDAVETMREAGAVAFARPHSLASVLSGQCALPPWRPAGG